MDNIFLSYSHYTNKNIVELFNKQLEKNFTVWRDTKGIYGGDIWPTMIDTALNECSLLLLLLDTNSMSESSFCRKEILMAQQLKKPIVIAKLEEMRIPSIIIDYHFVDFSDCFDFSGEPCSSAIHQKFESLTDSISKKLYTNQPRPIDLSQFSMISQSSIEKRLSGFIGGEWLSNIKNDWLYTKKRVLLLTGNAGCGKSMLSSYIYSKSERAVIHYCDHANEKSSDVFSFILSIAAQLCDVLPEYKEWSLKNVSKEDIDNADINTLFENIINTPLKTVFHEGLIIIVDGLDEIISKHRKRMLDFLFGKLYKLPDDVRFVYTSRNEDSITNRVAVLNPYRVDNIQEKNRADIGDYIKSELSKSNILYSREGINRIINQSGGDFLYVKFIINELLIRGTSDISGIKFPIGMVGVCQSYFDRLFENDKEFYDDAIRPFLEVLIALKEPPLLTDLEAILSADEDELHQFVLKMDMFLLIKDGRLYISHKSLSDWLKSMTLSDPYYISKKNGDKLICDWIVKTFSRKNNFCPYAYNYGMAHLIERRSYGDKIVSFVNTEQDIFVDMLALYFASQSDGEIFCTVMESLTEKVADINKPMRLFIKCVKGLIQFGKNEEAQDFLSVFSNCEEYELMKKFYDFITMKNSNKDVDSIIALGEDCITIEDLDNKTKADIFRILGDAYRESGDAVKATVLYNNALELCSDDKQCSTYSDCECALIDIAYINGEVSEVFQRLQKMENSIDFVSPNVKQYKFYRLRGNMYHLLNKRDEALSDFMACYDIADKLGFKLKAMESLNSMAEMENDPNQAKKHLDTARRFWTEYNLNKLEYGKSFYIEAGIELSSNDWSEALRLANVSEEILSEVGYESGIARARFYKGLSLYNLGQYENARNYFQLAFDYYNSSDIYPIFKLNAYRYLLFCDYQLDKNLDSYSVDFVDTIKNLHFFPETNVIAKSIDMLCRKIKYFRNTDDNVEKFLVSSPIPLSGYYNENYIFEENSKKYLLRLPLPNAEEMDLRLLSEETILYLLEQNQIKAPRLLFEGKTPSGKKYYLHSYIPGNTIESIYKEDSPLPDWIPIKIADFMCECHKLDLNKVKVCIDPMPWKLNASDLYNHIYSFNRSMIEKCEKTMAHVYNTLSFPMQISQFIENKVFEITDENFALCHSDIHRKNIILDPDKEDFTVIDWELALIATPCYDLSIHIHKMRYSDEQTNIFLKRYSQQSGIPFADICKQVDLFRALEEVKSIAVDIVRYSEDIKSQKADDSLIDIYTDRYFKKINKAYNRWNTPESQRASRKRIYEILCSYK